jgi:ribosomal protein RSM22 (predicted rRNA methylase)
MELPLALRMALEQLTETNKTTQLCEDAQNLSIRYRSQSGRGERLLTVDSEAAAYAAVRMPATFGAVSAALTEALVQWGESPATLLDVGAGTGAASWAADALLTLTSVTCVEREEAMRRAGQTLMQSGSPALQTAQWHAADLTKEGFESQMLSGEAEKPELVIASYVLNELTEDSRRKAALRLWELTGGMLLLVEPGTPEAFRQLMEIRSLLLKAGAHLAAPCPQERACPLKEGDWCHFSCRVMRSRLHRYLKGGDVPYEDEKFSYLALTRTPCRQAEARVLRHPQISPGVISLQLCTRKGMETRAVRKRDGAAFKTARKAKCGGVFSASSEEE